MKIYINLSLISFFLIIIFHLALANENDLKANPSLLAIKSETAKVLGDKFIDKSFVITGTLSQSRSHYEKIIKENGGKVSSSVSKKTSFLLCGESPGSKFDKAESLGVKIISEDDFNVL